MVSPAGRQRRGVLSFFMVAGLAFAAVGIVLLIMGLSSGDMFSNMGLTITGGTFAMIGVIWVIVALGVGGWYSSIANKQAAEAQLFQTGERATAVIEGVEGTGVEINNQPQVYLTLRVKPSNGQEFMHQRKLVLPFGSVVQPGHLVEVAYDPANPDNVALETDPRYVATPPALYIKTRAPDGQGSPVHAFTNDSLAAAHGLSGGMSGATPNAFGGVPGAGFGGVAGAGAGAGAAASDGSPPTLIEQIERLAKLRDAGALTEAEFQEQKANLLGG
jgi:hypothetical protein